MRNQLLKKLLSPQNFSLLSQRLYFVPARSLYPSLKWAKLKFEIFKTPILIVLFCLGEDLKIMEFKNSYRDKIRRLYIANDGMEQE